MRWLGLPSLVGAAAGIALALACVQLLARGTTQPLREMAAVASAMARGEHGRQVAVTSTDEVGELARAFNRMTAELAETDRLRRDLVANVSHELRTPLGALQAVLENVVDGVSEPDPETLRTMLAQTRRLGRLVTQLLDLSRLEAGDQPFDIRPFAVRDVLEGAAREARLHAPEDVVFSIDAPAELQAAGDPERIHQVVMNLVENAVRYSPRPGEIALRASPAPTTRSRSRSTTRAPGIPAEDLERVFERFYRGDGARATVAGRRRRRRRRPRPRDRALDRRAARRHDPRRAPRAARQPHGRHAARGARVERRAARFALAAVAAGVLAAMLLPGAPVGAGYAARGDRAGGGGRPRLASWPRALTRPLRRIGLARRREASCPRVLLRPLGRIGRPAGAPTLCAARCSVGSRCRWRPPRRFATRGG